MDYREEEVEAWVSVMRTSSGEEGGMLDEGYGSEGGKSGAV